LSELNINFDNLTIHDDNQAAIYNCNYVKQLILKPNTLIYNTIKLENWSEIKLSIWNILNQN